MAGKLKAGALGRVTPCSRGCLRILTAGCSSWPYVQTRLTTANHRATYGGKLHSETHAATDMHQLQAQTAWSLKNRKLD